LHIREAREDIEGVSVPIVFCCMLCLLILVFKLYSTSRDIYQEECVDWIE
jgi:hypothetical protein